MIRATRTALVAAAAVLAMSGCSSTDSGAESPSSPTPMTGTTSAGASSASAASPTTASPSDPTDQSATDPATGTAGTGGTSSSGATTSSTSQATSASSTGGAPANGTTLTLAVGDSAMVGDTKVTLGKIVEDSRCPKGTRCVWAGRVRVEVRTSTGKPVVIGLPAAADNPDHAQSGPVRLTLNAVTPEPTSGRALAVANYRVKLTAATP